MVVECRDIAYQATQGRKNRIFEKKKDSDTIKEVLKAYGSVKVEATTYQYPEMVQYYCSDWDFALSRADANGLFVCTEGKDIKVFKPKVGRQGRTHHDSAKCAHSCYGRYCRHT